MTRTGWRAAGLQWFARRCGLVRIDTDTPGIVLFASDAATGARFLEQISQAALRQLHDDAVRELERMEDTFRRTIDRSSAAAGEDMAVLRRAVSLSDMPAPPPVPPPPPEPPPNRIIREGDAGPRPSLYGYRSDCS